MRASPLRQVVRPLILGLMFLGLRSSWRETPALLGPARAQDDLTMPPLGGIETLRFDDRFQTFGTTDDAHFSLSRGEGAWLGEARFRVEDRWLASQRILTATVPVSVPLPVMAKLMTDLEGMPLLRELPQPTMSPVPDNYLVQTLLLATAGRTVVRVSAVGDRHWTQNPWLVDLPGGTAWSDGPQALRFWLGIEPYLAPATRADLRRKLREPPPRIGTVSPLPALAFSIRRWLPHAGGVP